MSRPEEALLTVRGLRTWFPIRSGFLQKVTGWVRAVDGVDLTVPRGGTLALVGESGCGKTTVGRTILGLEPAREGSIEFDGQDLLALDPLQRHPYRRRIQMIFQDPAAALDPRMRIRDAIAEGMQSFDIGSSESERTDRVAALLERVQLDPAQMQKYPHEFSGGQRQRICIARALAVEPELLICDESVSALDVSIQAQILNLLQDLQDERGIAYLFITHDLSVVRYLAERIAVMYLGQIVEEGETARVFDTPAHPYTRGLLGAIPSVDPDVRGRATLLSGDVPSPTAPPAGCRFHTRCPDAFDRCGREVPGVFATGTGASRCFLAETDPPEPG